jgi:hypothetical protein
VGKLSEQRRTRPEFVLDVDSLRVDYNGKSHKFLEFLFLPLYTDPMELEIPSIFFPLPEGYEIAPKRGIR